MRDGAKIYEFLLELKEEKDVSGKFTGRIEMESISEEDLEKLQTEEEVRNKRSEARSEELSDEIVSLSLLARSILLLLL